MNWKTKGIAAMLLAMGLQGASYAGDSTGQIKAFTGAKIYTISGDVIENGTLLIRGDKIAGVGKTGTIKIPTGAAVMDASGKIIMPGIVDTHSHAGVSGDGNERSSTLNPDKRIMDSLWPADPRFKEALAGGITTGNIMPGSGNVIGGQTLYVKYRGGSVEDMMIKGSIGGMKMANGENPKGRGARGKGHNTRMASAALARQAFLDAQTYGVKKAKAAKDKKPFAINLGHEALLEVLAGKRTIHHHTHRTDDIMTVLRLQREFGFKLVIQHGIGAKDVAKELAAANAWVSHIIVDSPGGKLEAVPASLDTAGVLERAGIKVALHTDDPITESRFLLRQAALAVRAGMSKPGALRALTLSGAEMLGLDGQLGSLEKGKDADFIILDGEPLSVYSHVTQTWIDGKKRFDRSNKSDRLYATGGFRIEARYPTKATNMGEK